MNYTIYFPKMDLAVYASWNNRTQKIECDHGLDDIFPGRDESNMEAIRRVYPSAEIFAIRPRPA